MVQIVTLLFTLILFQQEKIPVPLEEAPYTSADVVIDKESEEKFICDQIQVIFADNITRSEQLAVLLRISGKIVGGIPDMNIYQISFPNPKRSLKRQRDVISKLQKNQRLLHVDARKGKSQTIEPIEIEVKQPERKGEINMQPQERIVVEKKNEIQEILEKNREGLLICKKKKSTGAGEILFRLTINPEGQIKQVKVLTSTMKDELLLNCLEYKIRQWTGFPANGKFDRQVEFTFMF
jgi:hypothetical protein